MNANNGTHPNSTANPSGVPHQNTMLNASQETPGFNASAHTASQAYSAQQQWTPEAAYASYTSPAQNGPVQQKGSVSKTKKQLIGLTCALSLVCGMLGGVIGGGLSNAASNSSQPGGMQQSSMQQPGGQDGSSGNAGGTAGTPDVSNNGQGSQNGQAGSGSAPSAPSANGSATGTNDSSDDVSQSNSSASSGSTSNTSASSSISTQVI